MSTPLRILVVTIAVATLAPMGPSRAAQRGGTISGRVDLRRTSLTLEHRPTVSELGLPARRAPAEPPRAVVYLETAPGMAFPDVEAAPRVLLDQRDETFVPHVLAVGVGTTVDFRNSDQTYHNVFSLRGPRPFDLGRYASGKSKSVRFDRPGIVRVFCEIHPHMSAFILVFAHSYYAVTAADGRYQIPAIPPGRYTVVAWSEGAVRESRSVVVPDDNTGVEADFDLR